MKLGSIHFYPVKSTAGHAAAEAEVQPWGLAGDRRYLITGESGKILTAREEPRLLACVARLDGDTLTLTGPHAEPLRVTPSATRSTVDVWGTPVELTDCGDDAARWLSALAGRPARLVWLDDPTRRPVDPAYGRPGDRVSLADGYPLLLTSAASLARLDDWIAETALELGEEVPEPLPMTRFRPNVVIEGVDTPFAEDEWKRVRIGDVDFRVTKGCDRCTLTTIDLATYTKGKEPLRTLARHRKWDRKVWFGINLIPDAPGRIAQGDSVAIL
ncbi:MOSC domain-containing protein [Nonomuraea sp. K274]|uniref:MOSC domain-containing protein n=1 Tax=Nonomuraea cypriaca TaxID=1187855 RepID=A0A931F4R5_9ACTN|nr:MOSC N-terminal beta barrel domain-containing protein [Nonomuraea cypriaca]MBF8193955.1 MOSC domain-containing protein [Nonomuraea cypriaca]